MVNESIEGDIANEIFAASIDSGELIICNGVKKMYFFDEELITGQDGPGTRVTGQDGHGTKKVDHWARWTRDQSHWARWTRDEKVDHWARWTGDESAWAR